MLVRYPHLVGTLELLLAVIVTCSKATYLEAFLVKSVLTTRFRRQYMARILPVCSVDGVREPHTS